jgi:hypothetical protein
MTLEAMRFHERFSRVGDFAKGTNACVFIGALWHALSHFHEVVGFRSAFAF